MSAVGAPDIERAVASSHAGLAIVLLVVPGVISLVLEPIIFLLADRWPRRWFIRGGLAAMTVGSIAAALAPNAATLAISLGLTWVATGAAAGLAQATLVDRTPPRTARARWRGGRCCRSSAISARRSCSPASRRSGTAGARIRVIAGAALAIGLSARPAARSTITARSPRTPKAKQSLMSKALRDRRPLLWLFGTALCDLLDEILVVFASLHVRDDLGAGPIWQSVVVGAFIAGGAIGLVALERVLRRVRELTLLAATAFACVVAYLVWLAAPTPWASALLIVPVGVTAAPLYPLAAAQAYAARPNESGAVLAASHLFTPLGLALPWILGVAADHWGTTIALALLVLEPIGLGLLALVRRESREAFS